MNESMESQKKSSIHLLACGKSLGIVPMLIRVWEDWAFRLVDSLPTNGFIPH